MSFGAAGTREVAQMLQEQLPLAVGRFDQCFGRMGISFAKTDRSRCRGCQEYEIPEVTEAWLRERESVLPERHENQRAENNVLVFSNDFPEENCRETIQLLNNNWILVLPIHYSGKPRFTTMI